MTEPEEPRSAPQAVERCAVLRVAPASSASAHRFAGPSPAGGPRCPFCRVPQSAIFRIDFDDPALAQMRRWQGVLTTYACLDCTPMPNERMVWQQPPDAAPTLLTTPHALHIGTSPTMPAPALPLALTVRDYDDELEAVSRAAGPLRWLGGPRFPARTRPLACELCGLEMRLLAQWADRHLWPDATPVYEQPYVYAWLGCIHCYVVAGIQMLAR